MHRFHRTYQTKINSQNPKVNNESSTAEQTINIVTKMQSFCAFSVHFILFASLTQRLAGEWCIADEQTPESELKFGLDWACGPGGANCSKIQTGQACFQPNTMRAHASYAFNNYFQKMKHKGGNCYFKGSAIITDLDPRYSSCNYELTP